LAGTTAHYEDVAYYDKTYANRIEDVRFYTRLAASQSRGVLEYGAGSGRITIPMAIAGASVVAVDRHAGMLAELRTKRDALDPEVRARITLRRGDMRTLRVGAKFGLVICPFNTFLHLYDRPSVERFLRRVRAHLRSDGRFVFDVSMPQAEELARKVERAYRTPPFAYPGVGRVRYTERFDYEPLRQILFVNMEFEPEVGERFNTPLTHRQFFPQELEALLHYNGFAIEKIEGDFAGEASNESMTLVYTTRLSRRAR
jgi:SAM-dependent methyltransferase